MDEDLDGLDNPDRMTAAEALRDAANSHDRRAVELRALAQEVHFLNKGSDAEIALWRVAVKSYA